ncbi:MAG: ribosome maturation factor RimM [Candidatus Dormibacteria bacterium]
MTDEPIRVARVIKPHGLDGGLVLQMLGGSPERLAPGSRVRLDGVNRTVEEAHAAGRGVLCRLSGVSDLSAATAICGKYLEVDRTDLRPLPEGEHFDFQLIGLRVLDSSGRTVGELVEVEPYPAHDVYLLRLGNRELRVPAVRAAIADIDLSAGTVTVADPYLEEWVDAV